MTPSDCTPSSVRIMLRESVIRSEFAAAAGATVNKICAQRETRVSPRTRRSKNNASFGRRCVAERMSPRRPRLASAAADRHGDPQTPRAGKPKTVASAAGSRDSRFDRYGRLPAATRQSRGIGLISVLFIIIDAGIRPI